MKAITSLIMAANMALGMVAAFRLLRLGARTRGPERWLGVYFLFTWLVGFVLASMIYLSMSGGRFVVPAGLSAPLHAVYVAASGLGLFGIGVFTQRVFHPTSALARGAVISGGITLVLAWIAFGITEGFAVAVMNGPSYWVAFAVRQIPIVWLAVESFRYAARLRLRVGVGLTDPVLANRFLLWGIWATAVSLMQGADPTARLWYWWVAGNAVTFDPEIGKPMILATLGVTSLLGTIAASALLLAFFPTAAYRRWLTRRAIA